MFYKLRWSHFGRLNPKWLPLHKEYKIGVPYGEHVCESQDQMEFTLFVPKTRQDGVGPDCFEARWRGAYFIKANQNSTLVRQWRPDISMQCSRKWTSNQGYKILCFVLDWMCLVCDVRMLYRFLFPQGICSIYLLANWHILKPLPQRGNIQDISAGIVAWAEKWGNRL